MSRAMRKAVTMPTKDERAAWREALRPGLPRWLRPPPSRRALLAQLGSHQLPHKIEPAEIGQLAIPFGEDLPR